MTTNEWFARECAKNDGQFELEIRRIREDLEKINRWVDKEVRKSQKSKEFYRKAHEEEDRRMAAGIPSRAQEVLVALANALLG